VSLLMLLPIETASVLRKPFPKGGAFHFAAPVDAILHSTLNPRKEGCNLVLELQTLLLELFNHSVGGRFLFRFDAMDIAIDVLLNGRQAARTHNSCSSSARSATPLQKTLLAVREECA
jgi:hypothetical protein